MTRTLRSPPATPQFTLFIGGKTPGSATLAERLRVVLGTILGQEPELRSVDVRTAPALAEERQILATPTLVVDLPDGNSVRLIGDLTDGEALSSFLHRTLTTLQRKDTP